MVEIRNYEIKMWVVGAVFFALFGALYVIKGKPAIIVATMEIAGYFLALGIYFLLRD